MTEVLRNASSVMILISAAVSGILSIFMIVQAVMDPLRRWRFVLFASTWCYLILVDFLHPVFKENSEYYELLRLFWGVAYIGSLLWLLNARSVWIWPVVGAFLAYGAVMWSLWPAFATTAVFPLIFACSAVAHNRKFRRDRGYASAVLCAVSVALGMFCAVYYPALATGNKNVIMIGYIHWALLNITAVLFGWIHLPRELQGRAPVKVEPLHAGMLAAALIAAEFGVIACMLFLFMWPPLLCIVSTSLGIGAVLLLYFHHRHRLVIYAEDVTALLEERTASLRDAREELARQNEIQARKLEEQAAELKAKAEVIERQRRLELAAQTAGQTAHDIQNIIFPILANVAEIERNGLSPDESRGAAANIRRKAEHLLDLNTQLLSLARRGRSDFQPLPVREVVDDLPGSFPGKILSIDLRDDPWVMGSWSQLFRAAANLATNAFEASPAGDGRIDVRVSLETITATRRCHMGFLEPGTYARIEVADRGSGIPTNILDRIFEPFFSSKKGDFKSGSGLGLSIVAGVIDDHNGVIDLKTGPEGTLFTLYIPAISPPVRAEGHTKMLHSATVVVVECNDSVRRRYEQILEHEHFFVFAVPGGKEAVEIVQREMIDVVIIDLSPPFVDDSDRFIAGLLALRPDVRIIGHTPHIAPEERDRLLSKGIAAILPKPAGRTELLNTINQVLAEAQQAESVKRKAQNS